MHFVLIKAHFALLILLLLTIKMQIWKPKIENTTILWKSIRFKSHFERFVLEQCHRQWRSQFQALVSHLKHRYMCIRSRNSAYFMIFCRISFHWNSRSASRKLILAGSGCAFLTSFFTCFGDALGAALLDIQAQNWSPKTLDLRKTPQDYYDIHY